MIWNAHNKMKDRLSRIDLGEIGKSDYRGMGAMKRITHLLGFVILAGLLAGVAAAQDDSLADAARAHRKQKEAKPVAVREVFTNDNLPRTETISTVGAPAAEPDGSAPPQTPADPAADQPAEKDGKPAEAKIGDSAAQRQKAWEVWRDKISKQKQSVDQLQKDADEAGKDNQLRANTYMGSAQSRIFGGAEEAKAEIATKEQTEQRKKAIDAAKQKLDDMQEEARRAGVPSSFRE